MIASVLLASMPEIMLRTGAAQAEAGSGGTGFGDGHDGNREDRTSDDDEECPGGPIPLGGPGGVSPVGYPSTSSLRLDSRACWMRLSPAGAKVRSKKPPTPAAPSHEVVISTSEPSVASRTV